MHAEDDNPMALASDLTAPRSESASQESLALSMPADDEVDPEVELALARQVTWRWAMVTASLAVVAIVGIGAAVGAIAEVVIAVIGLSSTGGLLWMMTVGNPRHS